MNRTVNKRLAKLEQRSGGDAGRRLAIEYDADLVRSRLMTMACTFSADVQPTPEELASWSVANHVAWAIRFSPGTAGTIIAEHMA